MNWRQRLTILGLLFIGTASLLSCSAPMRPDLQRLYSDARPEMNANPVIIIPGILGSRLRRRDTHEEIWPGSLYNLLVRPKGDLALKIDPQTLDPIDDGVEAYALFEGVLDNDFYGAIVRTLHNDGGYAPGTLGQPGDPGVRRYYVFAYDWRQDIVDNARALDAMIQQIRRDYGNPRLKVDLVAHSMGGLIARYFLRYGTLDALDGDDFPISMFGATKVRTVVLLGTPNLGSVSALRSFLVGYPLGLSKVPTGVLATMPSVYELLPHPINNWLIGTDGQVLPRDLYDVATWRNFHWSVFDPQVLKQLRQRIQDPASADAYVRTLQAYLEKRLVRARRFWSALTIPEPETPVKFVVFGGDCALTPARLVAEQHRDGHVDVRLRPEQIAHPQANVDYEQLMLEPGDGDVTKPSLLARQWLNPTAPRDNALFFPIAYSFFLCQSHEGLTGNVNFQDNLLNVLLSRDHPWDNPSMPLPSATPGG